MTDVGAILERESMPLTECGCVIWLGRLGTYGYGRICINGWDQQVHRVAFARKNGPIPDGRLVCHKCDVRSCINPDHLFLGSVSDNARDMARKNRHGRPKLTPMQALAIRVDERRQKVIAAEYGVDQSLISRIRSGHKWVSV